jgi:hypothetical protein
MTLEKGAHREGREGTQRKSTKNFKAVKKAHRVFFDAFFVPLCFPSRPFASLAVQWLDLG